MKTSKKFPESAGWITAKLSLKKGERFTDSEAREFMSFGEPHRLQFGLVDCSRNPVRIIFREIGKAAQDPDAEYQEIDFDIHHPVPFIAKCGNVTVEVLKVHEDMLPMEMIRAKIIKGMHFNDRGNYGPGDEVNIGPLTEHWKILQFPDLASQP
jgi:hypothetical protein